jgi:type II secretory pathway component PulJ
VSSERQQQHGRFGPYSGRQRRRSQRLERTQHLQLQRVVQCVRRHLQQLLEPATDRTPPIAVPTSAVSES